MNTFRSIYFYLPLYFSTMTLHAQSGIDDQIDSLIHMHAHFENRTFENFSIKEYRVTRLRTKDDCEFKLSVQKAAQYGQNEVVQQDYIAFTRFAYIEELEISWVYGGSGVTMRSNNMVWTNIQGESQQRFDNWTLIMDDPEKATELQRLIQIKVENCKTLN
ncbi:MAG: hypothetical protein AAF696_29660 [Bacteroidota bacterium]